MRKVPLQIYSLQPIHNQFLNDFTHRFIVNSSGRRARKTLLNKRKILLLAMRNPDTNWLLGAPTRGQAKNIFWKDLISDTYYLRDGINKSDLEIILKNDSSIRVVGLDESSRVEGKATDGIFITEVGSLKPDVIPNTIMPMLSDEDRMGYLYLDGKPVGRNHYYQHALYATGGNIPTSSKKGVYIENSEDKEWAYYSWYSSSVLNEKEIADRKRQLDPRTFRQEYEASFESYEGVLYYNFDRKFIKNIEPKLNEPLTLTCDFNKSPLVWEVVQHKPEHLNILDEIYIPLDAKTIQGADLFIHKFKEHRNKIVYLTGDSSGNVETTRDWSTDYLIIQDYLRKNGWQVVTQIPSYNPNINNRVNVLCSLFNKEMVTVSPKCKELINDWENVTGDNRGGKDKTDPYRTHSSDAIDYVVYPNYKRLLL